VNTNISDPAKLKGIVDKEKLNWRSFVIQQEIRDQWNEPGTPMYYVIDHQGVIRFKWSGSPGENAMESALEELIQEARRPEARE
jgi:hypothetical protein